MVFTKDLDVVSPLLYQHASGGTTFDEVTIDFLRADGEGNRVKVTVRFRGREMAHTNIGEELLNKFAEQCGEVATVDKNPKLDGRHMTMFLSPKASKETRK